MEESNLEKLGNLGNSKKEPKKWGGPRPNSGRPKKIAPANTFDKTKIINYFNEEEVKELVEHAKALAFKDSVILKHLLEQLFGKPPQTVDLGNKDGNAFILKIVDYDRNKNNPSGETKII